MDALGEAASQLPWLSPCAASLVALARAPTAAVWTDVRSDPGCVLLLARSLPSGTTPSLSLFPAVFRDPAVLDSAARHLRQRDPGFVPWDRSPFREIYSAALTHASLAEAIAACSERADPTNAWVAGLLSPLGWLAICAAGQSRILPSRASDAINGCDYSAIARRLARQWRLPGWLAVIAGHLGLPVEVAQTLGAEPDLFRVVQLAVVLAEQRACGIAPSVGARVEELAAELGLTSAEVDEIRQTALEELVACPEWQSPLDVPLLADLLQLAADNRRLRDWPVLDRAEQDLDALDRALLAQRASEAQRLQTLKLSALAEVAAGAGHEINNPLAVISGQAQSLLRHETDPERRRSLQTIIGQTNRIHQTVTDLMQFARPSPPKTQTLDVGGLLREVTNSLRDYSEQRQVQLEYTEPATPITVQADPAQMRTAVRALLRNAIEAAPAEGWASVRVVRTDGDEIQFWIEDNGRGPSATEREHMFDPFYCGRKAGRSRGLGLSTAWRLAREHGGEVRYERHDQGPTRFVLSLPPRLQAEAASQDSSLPTHPESVEPLPERNGTNGCRISTPAAS